MEHDTSRGEDSQLHPPTVVEIMSSILHSRQRRCLNDALVGTSRYSSQQKQDDIEYSDIESVPVNNKVHKRNTVSACCGAVTSSCRDSTRTTRSDKRNRKRGNDTFFPLTTASTKSSGSNSGLVRHMCLLVFCMVSWGMVAALNLSSWSPGISWQRQMTVIHEESHPHFYFPDDITRTSESLPLVIPILHNRDRLSEQFHAPPTLRRTSPTTDAPSFPDHAGLIFRGAFGEMRVPSSDDVETAERYWNLVHDDSGPVSKHKYPDDRADIENECQPQAWSMVYHPSCNAVHEVPLPNTISHKNQMFESSYISLGYYRDVWSIHQVGQDVTSVWKTLRWEHPFSANSMFTVLRDAVVMEGLSSSPRIVDAFGHCGTTVWVEAMPLELEPIIVPGSGYIKQAGLNDQFEVRPQNNITAEEKLEIALAMAESLADLHGFKSGLISHNDVQLSQWLRDPQGNIKLGDFNLAAIPDFNVSSGEYCTVGNFGGEGNYRSPEEYNEHRMTEKVDVFSLGNNIYALLTGLWVFYEDQDDEVVMEKVAKGETAFIDPRYRTRSYIEGQLVEVMEKCWTFDPQERIDIFEVVRLLRDIQQEYYNKR